jgi:hypothetical protein
VKICPNYVLSENHLIQERQNIFIAHEVAQMVPLYGHALYRRLREHNVWVADYLANANGINRAEKEQPIGHTWSLLKRLLEAMLSGRMGDVLERWEYRRKLRRFAGEMQTPHNSARLDDTQVKGHFNDHGHFVLRQYAERLQAFGIQVENAPVSGD